MDWTNKTVGLQSTARVDCQPRAEGRGGRRSVLAWFNRVLHLERVQPRLRVAHPRKDSPSVDHESKEEDEPSLAARSLVCWFALARSSARFLIANQQPTSNKPTHSQLPITTRTPQDEVRTPTTSPVPAGSPRAQRRRPHPSVSSTAALSSTTVPPAVDAINQVHAGSNATQSS